MTFKIGLVTALNLLAFTLWAQRPDNSSGYVFNKAPLKKEAYAALPVGSIKAKGWLLKQLELQRDGATGHAEDLYADKNDLGKESDWLGGDGNSWERAPYYVKGLVPLAFILDDAGLKSKARKWIDWTITSQQSNGFFGPAKNKDWWCRMPMLYAVKDYYEATGDKRVIGFFSKYFNYQHLSLDKEPLKEWSKARAGDNIELVLWLYNQTGEKFLLSLADKLKEQAYPWTDIYTNNRFFYYGDDFHTKHMVNVSQALKMPAIYSQKSKNTADESALAKGISHIMRDHGQSSGIASGTEFLAGKSTIQGVETCTVVEWMQSLETAARILKNPAFGDQLEKIAFNTLPAQYSRDIKEHLYYSQPNQIQCRWGNLGFDQDYTGGILLSPYSGMGCCRFNMHMGWPYFVKNSWAATPDGGLAVIAYAPVEVNAVVAGNTKLRLSVETNYPFEEQISIKVNPEKPAKFPMKLRVPVWAVNPVIKINGRIQNGVKPGEQINLNQNWKSGDEILLNFPMEVNTSSQVNNSVSVERGPLVYALQIEPKYFARAENKVKGFFDYEVFPSSAWNYGLVVDKKDLNKSFRIEKSAMPANPFVQTETPIKLKVKGRRIPSWKISSNGMYANEVPVSPVQSTEPEEELTLVPFGSENIRISCFPQIGEPATDSKNYNASFDTGSLSDWIFYGGGWFIKDGALNAASSSGTSKTVVAGQPFSDFVYEADISVGEKGNGGLIFRVSNPSVGADAYEGYYVGLNAEADRIEIGKSSNSRFTGMGSTNYTVDASKKYKLRIEAKGTEIKVFAEGMQEPLLIVRDDEFKEGLVGVRYFNTLVTADNLKIEVVK